MEARTLDMPDDGAARRVSRGIMQGIERQDLRPGERLVETDLAKHYGVGRNAVREAIQWLAATGAVEITRFRSAAIRRFDTAEAIGVLRVAEAMMGLIAFAAAERYRAGTHRALLEAALEEVTGSADDDSPGSAGRARRHFYRALLAIGGNRELQRLFPSLGLHIVYAQHDLLVREQAPADFRLLAAAITHNDGEYAQILGRGHVGRLRAAIEQAGDEGAAA